MLRAFVVVTFFASPASVLAADLVLGGRIEQVAAAGPLVAVVRGNEVRVLSEDGRSLLRLDLGAEAARASHPPSERREDDVLDLYGIPEEDRDDFYTQDLVEDETSLRERRAARQTVEDARPPRRALLAASDDELWIAAGRTLWQVTADGRAQPVAALPARFDHLAAAPDGRLVATSGAQVWAAADGRTFALAGAADGPVRALAAGVTGPAWLTRTRLSWTDASGLQSIAVPGARDVKACGSRLAALHDHGLLVISADGDRSESAARGRHLACGSAGPWTVSGPGLQVSTDGGRSFVERGDLPPAPLVAATAGRQCLWIATTSGLYCLPPTEGPPSPLVMDDAALLPAVQSDRARWAPLLPRLALAASAVTWSGHQDVRTVAYADFPLGSRPAPPRHLAQAEPVAVPMPAVPAMPLPLDREAPCLPITRAEAVALALVEPERARSYVARAGRAAWLPELRVRVDRRLGRSESLDLPAGGAIPSGPLGLDTANDVRYEARATWDLAKLVFSNDEMAAASQALRMADTRREIESLANRLYFERRRLKIDLPQSSTDTRARRELRVQELEAELDALSGGAFGRCLAAPP